MSHKQLRRLVWAVRMTLALGVAASITANILHAKPHPIAQAIAAWPAVAFLITVELVTRIPLERRGLGYVRAGVSYGIAAIAAWVSYWHMVDVVARYGETGSVPYLLPLSVDGLIVVASVSLVELAGRREARQEPAAPATAAEPTPAVTTSGRAATTATTDPTPAPVAPTLLVPPAPLPAHTGTGADAGQPAPFAGPDPATDARDGAASAEAPLNGDRDPHAEVPLEREPPDHDEDDPNDDPEDETNDGASLDPDLMPLLPAARQARDELLREGHTVSRDALARRLRRNGTAIRNDRVSELLRELRREAQQVNGSRPTVPA
ncbi:DUF2637 domain-containing protein [Krasilnikovia sp. MM14-A1259]|uniref:DUF2637 domain-containing protein n=1 Tax=Krasilnikovia sp. MM14-A1259 TaxID=3373539 RepID=UPI0037F7B619